MNTVSRLSVIDDPAPAGSGPEPAKSAHRDRSSLALPANDASEAAERSLRRLVMVMVPVWLVALAVQAAGPMANVSLTSLMASYAPVVGVLGLFVAGRDRRGYLLCLTLTAAAVAVAALGPANLNLSGYPTVEAALNLATLTTGLLCRGRSGVIAVLAVTAAGTLTVAVQQHLSGTPQPLTGLAALAGQALVDGFGAFATGSVLRAMAARSDRSARTLARTLGRTATDRAHRDETRRVTRALHDTVVNTLGAIAVLPPQDPELVRQRCVTDLAAVEALNLPDSSDPPDPLAVARERARVLGLDLTVLVRESGPPLPAGVGTALSEALGEALVNVAKHAGTRNAVLTWCWDGHVGSAVLTDDGVGIPDGVARQDGNGLRSRRHRSCESGLVGCQESGVRADVRPGERGGTEVRLTWTADPEPDQVSLKPADEASESLTPVMGRLALVVAVVIGGFALAATLVRPGGYPEPGSMATLIMVAAVVYWCLRISRDDLVWQPHPALFAVWAALMVLLPEWPSSGCHDAGDWWLGQLTGLTAVVAAIFIYGTPSTVGSALAGYVIGNAVIVAFAVRASNGCWYEDTALLVLGLCFSIAILAFRGMLSRQWEIGLRIRRETAVAEISQAEARARESARNDSLGRAMAIGRPLLRGLAAGQLDPRSPQVRFEAGRCASMLRSLISLPPDDPVLTPILADMVVRAARRHIDLYITCDSRRPLPVHRADEVAAALELFLGQVPNRGSGQVTVLTVGAKSLLIATTAEETATVEVEWS